MNFEVPSGTERKVIQDLRELLFENILPRLTDIEMEVKYLRQVCWPVCQAIREKNQLDNIKKKREFFRNAVQSVDEIKELLEEKQKINQRLIQMGIGTTTSDLIREELNLLFPI